MSRTYSDPNRENDPYSLPDVEVFYISAKLPIPEIYSGAGWYWRSCLPGCLPDSDPYGPFVTEAEALADAQEQE